MPIALLAPVVIALVALLIIYGGRYLAHFIAAIFQRIPVPGMGTVGRFVAGLADAAVAAIEGMLSAAVAPAVNLVLAGPRALGALFEDAADAAGALYWMIRRVTWWVDGLIAAVMAHLWAVEAVALKYAHNLYADAVARIYAVEAVALKYAHDLYADAVGRIYAVEAVALKYAHDLYADAVARIYAVEAAALKYAHNLYADAVARIYAVEAVALDYARSVAVQAERDAIATVDTTAAAVAGTVWPDITADADALAGELATDLPDLRALVDAIPRVRPLDLADALAGVGAVEAVLTKYLRDCGVPNCRNLGKFGHDLQALFGLVEDGALFALLAALITDPGDTVRPLHDFLAPLAGDAVAAGRALAGV